MLYIGEVYLCPEVILVFNNEWRWNFLAHIVCFLLCRLHYEAVCYVGMRIKDIVETERKYLSYRVQVCLFVCLAGYLDV
jgi:hypothetical protein